MIKKGYLILLGFLLILLTSCGIMDDYFLGKDNTPKPETLGDIPSSVNFITAWKVSVGGTLIGAHEKLAPVLKGDHIYVATTRGSIQDRDISTGKLYWHRDINEGIIAGPSIGEDRLAVVSHSARLIILEPKQGKIIWEQMIPGKTLAKPLIAEGKVLVKTVNGMVLTFDLQTGKRLWKWSHGSNEVILQASSSPILLPHHLVLVAYADGKLDAFKFKTGEVVWQKGLVYSTGATDVERLVDIDADPLIYRDTIILGSYQGFIGALSLENNELKWRQEASIYQNMVIKNQQLWMTDDADVVWSLNPDQGQVLWKQVHLKARGLTSPAWTSLALVVADKRSMLHALSLKDGTLIGRMGLSAAVWTPPVVHGNRIFVLTENGYLYAIDIVSKRS